MKLLSIAFAALAFSMVACEKEKAPTTYTGPDVVEFSTTTRSFTTTTPPKNDSILVQLVGPLRTTNTKVNFEIDASTTAVATTDYAVLTPSPVEIPAGTLSTWIKFRLSKVSTAKTLKINLTGADNASPSANYKSFIYSLK